MGYRTTWPGALSVRDDDGKIEIRACDPEGQNWRTLWAFSEMKDRVWPLGFGLDPQELYVRAHHGGRLAVFTVRLDDAALPKRLRLANPRNDVSGQLLRSPLSGEVLGLRTRSDDQEGDSDETCTELWDDTWRAHAKAIDLGLPQRENLLLDMSRDEQQYLVYSSGNGVPGT